MTTRPYFRSSIKELEALVEKAKGDPAIRQAISNELSYRKTAKAQDLIARIAHMAGGQEKAAADPRDERGEQPHHQEPPREAPLTLEGAYKVFDATPTTPFEAIETARRKLIQQYHPDRVASLGPKLRDLAEREAKLINQAFQMLSAVRQR